MDLENHWLTTVGLIASSLTAIASNSLLLLVFCRRRGLRTVSNRFVINLLFINLLSGLLLVPFLIVDAEAGKRVPVLENLNISTTEFLGKTTTNNQYKTLNNKEVVVEKQSSEVINGTFYESRQLLIDNQSSDLDVDVVIQANFSLNLQKRNDLLFCKVSQFSLNFICTASILSILLIGIDQYFAVLHPLRCHSYVNKGKSLVLIGFGWIVATIFAVLTTLTDVGTNHFHNLCPDVKCANHNLAFSIVYFLVIIVVPFISICIIYLLIYRAAHKNSSRMRKRNTNVNTISQKSSVFTAIPSTEGTAPSISRGKSIKGKPPIIQKVHSAPNLMELNKVTTLQDLDVPSGRRISVKRTHSEKPPKNIIASLRTKFSNATVFRYREESRTAKISVLVIVMVLVCYVPYGVLFILNTALPTTNVLHNLNYTSLLLLISSNLVSPILFAYRNRRVQRELKKFLTIHLRKDQYTLNRPKIVINQIDAEAANKSTDCVEVATEPFLVPEITFDCKTENEQKSILKRVCSKSWSNYKKCSFINVPDSCLDARGSFSSASTQISTEE